MIYGIGTDLAKISRFEKNLQHLMKRCLSEAEIAEINNLQSGHVNSMAKRFAAKEAFVKALGCGFRKGIYLRQIQVLHKENGAPYIELCGQAKKYFEQITNNEKSCIFVSLSDDGEYAQAFVVIEKYSCEL